MRRSLNELVTQATAVLPDNVTELISPADVRQMFIDFIDTMAPSYGGLQVATRIQNITATPAPVIFMESIISLPPQWTADFATGVLGRALAGAPKLNSRFTICGTILGAVGAEVKFQLYDGETPLAWIQFVSCQGTTKRSLVSFTGIDPIEADANYTLRVSTPTAGNFRFENLLFVGENIAIRDFNTGVDLPRMVAADTPEY